MNFKAEIVKMDIKRATQSMSETKTRFFQNK
jgi:hypothetical protein